MEFRRVRDVGRVTLSHMRIAAARARINPSVVLEIIKQPQADTVAITKGIDRFLLENQASLPGGVSIRKYTTNPSLSLIRFTVWRKRLLLCLLGGVILLLFLGAGARFCRILIHSDVSLTSPLHETISACLLTS